MPKSIVTVAQTEKSYSHFILPFLVQMGAVRETQLQRGEDRPG